MNQLEHGTNDSAANSNAADADAPAITTEDDVLAISFAVNAYLRFLVAELNWKTRHRL